jgi:hypothetical protein
MSDKRMRRDSEEKQQTRQTPPKKLPSSLISHLSSLVPGPWPLLFLTIWLILLLVGRSAMFRDPGTYWHVAAGKKMLAAGQVIREDPFSFTRAGKPWVADQWLAECGMSAIHDLAGWDGLLLATATLLAGVYSWIAARLLHGGLHWLLAVLLVAMAMMAGAPQFHVRPLVVTIVLMAVTFGWLVDVEAGRRRLRQLWWLVPLFLLWTNTHGGMLGGLGTVGICMAGWCATAAMRPLLSRNTPSENRLLSDDSLLSENSRGPTAPGAAAKEEETSRGPLAPGYWNVESRRPLPFLIESTALLIVLAGTMLISPYGLALPREWLDTLAMPLPDFIQEHARLDWSEPIGWATLALAAVYVATLIAVLPRWPRATWLVPLAWLVLAILRVRNVPLFGVTAVVALADMLPCSRVGEWLQRRGLFAQPSPPTPLPKGEGRMRGGLFVPFLVVAAAALLQIGSVRVPVVGRDWARFDPAEWPIELVSKLGEIDRSSEDGARIFNDMNFGGFLIYHAPRLRVFIDDRCPLYGDLLLSYNRARCKEPAQIDQWQRQYGFRYALVKTGEPFDRYLSGAADWNLVERAQAAALYRHKEKSL